MVGCGLIWGACALAVIAVMKHRRHAYWHGGGGCGRGGWDSGMGPSCGGRGRGGFRGFGVRALIRGLFERLDTTPGQEKAIVAALEELRESFRGAKDGMKGTRKDFADAFRRGPIDEAAMADIFVRHDTIISETRRKAVEAMGKVHEALDDKQRAEVADLIEQGPGFGGSWRQRGGYGYRW